MELRHIPEEQGKAESANLTAQELSAVLHQAIVLHGEEEANRLERFSSMDDALSIARELNISDEHVRAAVEKVLRNRELIGIKLEVQRKRRALLPWLVSLLLVEELWPLGVAVWLTHLALSLHHASIAAAGIGFGVVMSAVNWACYRFCRRFAKREISDEEAERAKKHLWNVVLGHSIE
jgi:hypothetical protein